MQHKFYNKSKKQRNQLLFSIGFGAFSLIALSLFLSFILNFYPLGIFTFWIVLSIIAPFFDTPSLKKSGHLIYHSSLFLSEKPKNSLITIHGGTLFDYTFVLDKEMNGSYRTKYILQQYLEGLLDLISRYEIDKSSNYTVRGTSYIVNERTADRMGFKTVKTNFIQSLILTFNYPNLIASFSLAKGKLSFPNLNATKTYEAKLDQLIDRKEYINALNNKLIISLKKINTNLNTSKPI